MPSCSWNQSCITHTVCVAECIILLKDSAIIEEKVYMVFNKVEIWKVLHKVPMNNRTQYFLVEYCPIHHIQEKSKIFTDTRSSSDTPIPIEKAFGDRYGYCLAWVHWLACSYAAPCKTRIYGMTFITSPWLKLSAICTIITILLAHNWWKSHNLHWSFGHSVMILLSLSHCQWVHTSHVPFVKCSGTVFSGHNYLSLLSKSMKSMK